MLRLITQKFLKKNLIFRLFLACKKGISYKIVTKQGNFTTVYDTLLKIIQQREGNDACKKFYNDNLVSYGKYLQVLFVFFSFRGDLNRIKTLIDNFLNDHKELTTLFNGMRVIPEDEETVKRRETVRVSKKPEDLRDIFADEEVAKLTEMAKDMELKAEQGLIREANVLFTDIYELMKRKRFSTNQKSLQCKLHTKFVAFHTMKHCYDDASLFASKMFEFADTSTPTHLKIEVCRNGAVALRNEKDLIKSSTLGASAVAIAKEHFGDKSTVYAEALIAFSNSNNSLETALKIVESKDGRKSVPYGRILSRMASNEYAIQYDTGSERYEEATKHAEKALKILTKQLGSKNILLVGPKVTLAAIKHNNSTKETSERKKAMLLKEVEKLMTENVDVGKEVLGEFNPLTSRQMSNLGCTYQEMGKNSEAEELLTRTLEVQTAMLGPDNESVARCHNFLGVLYDENMGRQEGQGRAT